MDIRNDSTNWNELPPEEFADEISAKLEGQPPLITDDDMDDIEVAFGARGDSGAGSLGLSRRCALVTLTKSGKELIKIVEKDRESAVAFAAVSLSAKSYADRLRRLAGLIETAHVRISVALCWREDVAEVLAEAEVLAAAEGQSEARH